MIEVRDLARFEPLFQSINTIPHLNVWALETGETLTRFGKDGRKVRMGQSP